MEKDSTIRVSLKNLKRLRQIAAKIALHSGKKMSLNDALTALLNNYENESLWEMKEDKKTQDRQKFLSLLHQSIEGAGPDDYKELEFDE
jgi:hypothetical protein